MGGSAKYSDFVEFDLNNVQTITGFSISGNKVWVTGDNYTNIVLCVIEVPSGSKYFRIKSAHNNSVLFLHSFDAPIANTMPDYSNIDKEHYVLHDDDVALPVNTKYVLILTHSQTADISPYYVGFATVCPSITGGVDEAIAKYNIGREIEDVSCPEEATVVMSTTDESATQYDNALIGYFNVLKIHDNMYYMYYSCGGVNDSFDTDDNQHLAFAYSTDGLNWVRGFPDGIEAPIEGTNLLFEREVIGAQVFKVMDNNYPYRLLAGRRDGDSSTNIYKSSDGIHFEKIRTVFPFYCDNQVSCIVRGNIVKVYTRWRSNVNGTSSSSKSYRWIGVYTIDIDGNVIAPPTILFGLNLYQASASILDDRREIAFPTLYQQSSDTQDIQCYIIDGKIIKRIDFDTNNIISDTEESPEKSFYVAPGLINIGGDMYMYLSTRSTRHNGFVKGTTVCKVKRAKVVYNTQGTYWKP